MLLRIQEAFHPYLVKYLRMVIEGAFPTSSPRGM